MLLSTLFEGRYQVRGELVRSERSKSRQAEGSVSGDRARLVLADDQVTGQTVAIKLLDQWVSANPQFRAQFEAETRQIRSFDHPNVVKNLASGVTPSGLPYLVMESLKGQTLDDLIAENGPIAPDQMANFLDLIASGLDAAHAIGIVHGNLSPCSIMLQSDSESQRSVKLLNFGLARDFAEDPFEVDWTSKAKSMANASYLSPERARGEKEDARSDIYSLGVVLYEALTGELPFQGKTEFQLILAHINTEVPPFPEGWLDDSAAGAIEGVVLQALAKDPASRPKSVGELSSLFRQALQPTPAKKPKLFWPAVAACAAVVVGLAILVSRLVS